MTNLKKKNWYALLEQYNRLVEEKEFNENLYDKASLSQVKNDILQYMKRFEPKFRADLIGRVINLNTQGVRADYAEAIFRNEWAGRWAGRADNIIAAINEERIITKEDMEDSYYGLRFFCGRLNLWQFAVVSTCVLIGAFVVYTMP